jgi:hypothetical protein
MRKILLSVVASCAVIAFVPASALAHGHHHKRHHHHHAHHARVRHWGSDDNSQGAGQSQDQTAGKVASFTNGVLTIALNDGSMVSGKVTSDTEIECEASDTSSTMQSHESGDDNGGSDNADNNDQGDDNNDQGEDSQGDDNGQGDDDANQACDMSNLTPGTVVQEAELKVSSAGAVWKNVDLATASAADNDNDDD